MVKIDTQRLLNVAVAISSECNTMNERALRRLDVTFRKYVIKNKLVAVKKIYELWPSKTEHLVPSYVLKSGDTVHHDVDLGTAYEKILTGTQKMFSKGPGLAFMDTLEKAARSDIDSVGTLYELLMYMLMPYTILAQARTYQDYDRLFKYMDFVGKIHIVWVKLKTDKAIIDYGKKFNQSKEAMILMSVFRRTMRRIFYD